MIEKYSESASVTRTWDNEANEHEKTYITYVN